MKKILVWSPAGIVYGHNCVHSRYVQKPEEYINKYYNIGDLFVFDSSLKLLKYDVVESLYVSSFSQERVDRYNAEFDYVFLRGSNYIHANARWFEAAKVLEKLKIPVIPFAVGAQSPSGGPINLSQETQYILKLISDKCERIGVRGAYTAEVLASIGIHNVDIIGCPTLYRNNNPFLQITLPPLESVEAVGFSLRREISNAYTSNIDRYLTLQRELIYEYNKRFTLTIMAQGEIEEKQLFHRRYDLIPSGIKKLVNMKWFEHEQSPMLDIYRNQLFHTEYVAEFDELVRKLDLVFGFRLHGNLISLANQTPAIYINYDSRTREFAETYQIPSFDIDSGETFRLEDYYRQDLFDKFNAKYRHYYRACSDFLTKNGMEHHMWPKY